VIPDAPVFERIAHYFGCTYAVPVGSGTVGLCVLLRALGAAGRRVAIPALACPNVAVAVCAAGAKPVLVDMSEATYDMSIEALARTLDDSFSAVIVIDAFGFPSDVAGAREVAKHWGCVVIEDACQAYGGSVGGTALGARGDVGVVSFGYAKPLELGGGGAIVTDDDALAERVRQAMPPRKRRLRSTIKNKMAVLLMKRGRYAAMIARDAHFRLLHYEFPRREMLVLEHTWDRWIRATARMRADLHAAGAYLASMHEVEPFAYTGRDWLPWRYSFKIAGNSDAEAFRRALAGYGVQSSRLYRPVTECLAVEVRRPIANAFALADRTVNLIHRSTVEDAARLRESLGRASGLLKG